MSALERRYRWLLRAYPGWYREDRGEEMLGTLLEAAGPGSSRPSAREVRTLILGGLRVRSGQDHRLPMLATLRLVVQLAIAFDLAVYASGRLIETRLELGLTFPSTFSVWVNLAIGPVTVAAIVAIWFGRRSIAWASALAAAGLWVYQPPGGDLVRAVEPVLALGLAVFLAARGPGLSRWWLALPVTLFAAQSLPFLLPVSTPPMGITATAFLVLLAGSIAWCAVDIRPMTAIAIWLAVSFAGASVRILTQNGPQLFAWVWWGAALISTAIAAAALWGLRRRAVL